MLTKLTIRNFKRLDDAVIELGNPVVFIGPNNSGKTTALQALSLWEVGLRKWYERRQGKGEAEKRPGVAINRRDLISIPIPSANLLWNDLHVRSVEKNKEGKQETKNIRIDIIVEGVTNTNAWQCGFEFDYANEESFYCRPLRLPDGGRMLVPAEASEFRLAYLPPMSGLAATEPKLESGRINVLLGEGQTAQVLRNLCYQIFAKPEPNSDWNALTARVRSLFGVELESPQYIGERGEIVMSYTEGAGPKLDLSASGRGLQQTLLLLAHLYSNPNTVLLLDEPDAHLEILRQRQIYALLNDVSRAQGSQVIAASHSEVVLNEAAGSGTVIAFVGKPHRMNDKGSQILKALSDIGWENYYQAEQTGWVMYLEDSTDLAILRAFAARIGHPAAKILDNPFVSYVGTNLPQRARDQFFGLREAKSDLRGIAIFDRLDKELHTGSPLMELMWSRREIENYFCTERTLLIYAEHDVPDDLFGKVERERRIQAMGESISEVATALATLKQGASPWSSDTKATDDFLDPVFRRFFAKLELPLTFRKSDYHVLAGMLPSDEMDLEIAEKLDAIVRVANEG